jgi:hypothetical protein
MKFVKSVFGFLVISCFLLTTSCLFAGGISTTCGMMYLGNLKIGQAYSLKQLLGYPFTVSYNGEAMATMNIYVETPSTTTKDGYDPLPSTSWISLERTGFALDPRQTAETDVTITIPDDEKYMGKKYMAYIVPQSGASNNAGGGIAIGTALQCALRLEIAAKPPTPEEIRLLKKQMLGQEMQVAVSPERIFLNAVPIGEKVDIKKEYGDSIKIINSSDFDCKVIITPLTAGKAGVLPPAGYIEAKNPDWLVIGKHKFSLKKNTIIEVPVYITLPSEVKQGEKLFFSVSVNVVSKIRQSNYLVKFYVETIPKAENTENIK